MQKEIILKKSSTFSCEVALFNNIDLKLESGFLLNNFQINYKTYGKLNSSKSNAILICHALTADQFISDSHPITKKDGLCTHMVGPGKPIDSNKCCPFSTSPMNR